MWLNALNFLIVRHHFAEFSGYRGSGDAAVEIVYVTLQDYLTLIKESDDFTERNSSLYIYSHPAKTDSHRYLIYNYISLSRDLTRLGDYTVMWLYGQKLLKVSHHPATFLGHKHCGSGDIMVLVCHVISQDRMTKRWSNIMGESTSWKVTSLPCLVVISIVVVKIWF